MAGKSESSLRRGFRDAWNAYGGSAFQWCAVIAAAFGGILVAVLTPASATGQEQTLYGVAGAVGSAIGLGLLFLVFHCFRAPYRQRDDFWKAAINAKEDLSQQLAKMGETRPKLSISLPDPHEDWWLLGRYSLIVSNDGNTAVVKAQVKVLEGLEYIRGYYQDTFTALWEGNTDSVQLMKGHVARIQLIEPDLSPVIAPPHFSQWWISRWDESNQRASRLETTSWLTFGSSPAPELTFEVTLSTHPSDPSGPAIRRYRLDGQGLREIGTKVNPHA